MTITNADRLLSLIRERPGLTERELAQSRFGEGAPQQRVNQDCTLLLNRGLVERRGKGGCHDPYRYHAAKSHLEPTCRQKVTEALELYREEVNAADLKPKTKQTYMRHAETFVRWLHGDFEPGGGNRFGSFILACVVAVSVMAPAMPSVAGSAEDAARIEMKFEIRKLAKEIFDRANARAEAAAEDSPTMKRLLQEAASALVECINSVTDLANAEAEHIRNGGEPNYACYLVHEIAGTLAHLAQVVSSPLAPAARSGSVMGRHPARERTERTAAADGTCVLGGIGADRRCRSPFVPPTSTSTQTADAAADCNGFVRTHQPAWPAPAGRICHCS